MMNQKEELPKEVVEQIVQWLPPVHPLWKRLVDRSGHGFFLPEDAQYLHLAAVCLHDLADTMQTAGKALYWAKHEWLRGTTYSENPNLQVAVHRSRFHFDYAAVSLCAASNHLASAMWHIDERADRPLGRNYKTAAAARNAWKQRRTPSVPTCLAILHGLVEDATWKTLSAYRDQWVHRGLPIIAGEVRQARRQIWQNVSDPPPKTPWLMKRETHDGRVSYFVQYDEPQFKMPDLLDAGAAAMARLKVAVEAFVPLFDAAYAPHGVNFDDAAPNPQPPPGGEKTGKNGQIPK